MVWFGLVYGDWRRFQQYFSYVVSVSFMGQINIFKGHFHFLHLMNVRCEVYLKQHYVNKLVTVTRDM
jgi:hypothetical protein